MVGHFEVDWHIVRKTSSYENGILAGFYSEPGLLLDIESEAYKSSAQAIPGRYTVETFEIGSVRRDLDICNARVTLSSFLLNQ
jgi:hypothetical protein